MFNGHYYNYVAKSITFDAAVAATTKLAIYKGMIGHLATITSAAENEFVITSFRSAKGWLATTDLASEGSFYFIAGPEVGQGLIYKNWASNQPDNARGNEDCVEIYGTKWNDCDCSALNLGYYVEYDCPGVLVVGAYGCTCKFLP